MDVARIILDLAALEDVPAIVDLCVDVERQHEAYWPLRWGLCADVRELYAKLLHKNIAQPRWLILCARDSSAPGQPAPVVGVLLAAIQEEIPIYADREYAFIHDLAVQPPYRRQGIAEQLLHEAKRWAAGHGVNQIRAMVAMENLAATALFQTVGYRPSHREMVLPTNAPSDPSGSGHPGAQAAIKFAPHKPQAG